MKRTTIVLAEDEIKTSNRVLETLDSADDLEVINCPATGSETLRSVREQEPDILLLDLSLQDVDGLQVLRHLDYTTETRTIILADHPSLEMLTQAVVLGACGVVDKFAPAPVLLKSIRSVVKGEFWFSRDVTKPLLEYLRSDPAEQEAVSPLNQQLTPRETDVMLAATWGLSNRQIAKKLSVSEHTVKQHLKRIFEKLNVSSRVELVLLALKPESGNPRPLVEGENQILRHRTT